MLYIFKHLYWFESENLLLFTKSEAAVSVSSWGNLITRQSWRLFHWDQVTGSRAVTCDGETPFVEFDRVVDYMLYNIHRWDSNPNSLRWREKRGQRRWKPCGDAVIAWWWGWGRVYYDGEVGCNSAQRPEQHVSASAQQHLNYYGNRHIIDEGMHLHHFNWSIWKIRSNMSLNIKHTLADPHHSLSQTHH